MSRHPEGSSELLEIGAIVNARDARKTWLSDPLSAWGTIAVVAIEAAGVVPPQQAASMDWVAHPGEPGATPRASPGQDGASRGASASSAQHPDGTGEGSDDGVA